MPIATLSTHDRVKTVTLSGGNLTATHGGTGGNFRASMLLPASGKFYWEATFTNVVNASAELGLCERHHSYSGFLTTAPGGAGSPFTSFRIDLDGDKKSNTTSESNIATAGVEGDTWRIAVDMDAGHVWFGEADGDTWFEGDPAAGTGASFTNLGDASELVPVFCWPFSTSVGSILTVNFGATAFIGTVPAGFGVLSSTEIDYAPFNTLNPADKGGSAILLDFNDWFINSDPSATVAAMIRAVSALGPADKAYFELTAHRTDSTWRIGVANASHSLTEELGDVAGGWGIDNARDKQGDAGVATSLGASVISGETVAVAIDVGAGRIWFGDAAAGVTTWLEGDPAAGTGASFTGLALFAGELKIAASLDGTADAAQLLLNVGQYPFLGAAPNGFVGASSGSPAGVLDIEIPLRLELHGKMDRIHGLALDIEIPLDLAMHGFLDPTIHGELSLPVPLSLAMSGTVFGALRGILEIEIPLQLAMSQTPEDLGEVQPYRIAYTLTLTGANELDATEDIDLPISSFQLRFRAGSQTFLSAVVPSLGAHIAAVTARSNGEMVINRTRQTATSTETVEIARALLDQVLGSTGGRQSSLVLNAHADEIPSTDPQLVSLPQSQAIFVSTDSASQRTRVRVPAVGGIRVGDSVLIGTTSFEVGEIVWTVGARSAEIELVSA